MRDVMKFVIAVKSAYQRSKMRAAAAGFGVPTYDDLGTHDGLHFQPVSAALLNVRAARPLCDHAFKMKPGNLTKEGLAFSRHMLREFDEIRRAQHLGQLCLSVDD